MAGVFPLEDLLVSIRSRDSWEARAPRSRQTVSWSRREEVTLHYSYGPTSQTPRQIQNHHMDGNGWSDVGYNFLVDSGGVAYEGRGWDLVGAHAAPRNVQGVGICYIGRDGMTDAAKRTVIALYDEACRRAGRTLDRKGHRDINSTSCPGTNNYRWWTSPNFRDVAEGPTTTEGESPMIGLKRGDTGPRVEFLQTRLRHAGFADLLGTYGPRRDGVDGEYGKGTEDAVLAARKYVGSSATSGATVTGPGAAQIERAATKRDIERSIAGLDLNEGNC